MKNSLAILPFLICVLTFCGRQDVITESLDRAESCMADRPDSALTIIAALDSTHFNSKSQKARYALLKSMALDKNYIDRTDESLVNVAVNYYRHRCNPAYKFKSYYYQARVYQNAGLMDKAMESLVRAEHIKAKSVSNEDKARLHFAKARLLSSRYNVSSDIILELTQAADYSKISGRTNNYHSALLDLANVYIINGEFNIAKNYLDTIACQKSLSHKNRGAYYEVCVLFALKEASYSDSLSTYTNRYLMYYQDMPHKINWMTVAQSYLYTGDGELAHTALEQVEKYHALKGNEPYYLLRSRIEASLGNMPDAYISMKKYSELSDSLNLIKINQEVKSVNERYEKESTILKQRTLFIGVFIIVISLLAYGFVFIYRYHKNERRLRIEYRNLHKECDYLSGIMKWYNENRNACSTNDQEVYEILNRRIIALTSFLTKDKPDSLSKIADNLDDLIKEKSAVADSIGLLYAIYHPNFVLRLREYDLTASEIGFCCLLLLGLKTSELSSVVNKSNTYNISSRIRAKLKLEHNSGKLSNWLTDLYAASEDEHKPVTDIL